MPPTVGAMKNASRRIGAIVQAISSLLLPCVCVGSPESPFFRRKRQRM